MALRGEERFGAVDERRVWTHGEDWEREKVCSGLFELEHVEAESQAFSPPV